MLAAIRKRLQGEKGFTLIELLVVIIIIAILAAIAIPTFLGQRQKAQDSAAKSLIRQGMTAVESGYVDTRSFAGVDAALLATIEPTIVFDDTVSSGFAASCTVGSEAKDNELDFAAANADTYELGAKSESGKVYAVEVAKTAGGGNTYYCDNNGSIFSSTKSWVEK